MSDQIRRFRIEGKLKQLVKDNLIERLRWIESCSEISKKYGFGEYYHTTSDFFSGGSITGFGDPSDKANLAVFRRPAKGVYRPRAKEGKAVQSEIDSIKDWSLKTIWDYLDYSPHPFGGNGGYYLDGKLDDELLFFSFDTEFKGHLDLIELKKSEYYTLIGE